MSEITSSDAIIEKIVAALRRNDYSNVHCEIDPKGLKLTGSVDTDQDRSIAFAIARTTAGTIDLSNGIQVDKKRS